MAIDGRAGQERLLTPSEAAWRAGVSESLIHLRARQGLLPYTRARAGKRFHPEAVDEFARQARNGRATAQ